MDRNSAQETPREFWVSVLVNGVKIVGLVVLFGVFVWLVSSPDPLPYGRECPGIWGGC